MTIKEIRDKLILERSHAAPGMIPEHVEDGVCCLLDMDMQRLYQASEMACAELDRLREENKRLKKRAKGNES